jgi:hypothetical protein
MSEIQKIMIAVIGVFVVGVILVGVSKQEPSLQEKEAAAKIRSYVAMQTMASRKCPDAIKEHTGEQVYSPVETLSDKDTYLTMKWDGENAKKDGFKKASCTITASLGGISELIIDDKVIINKKI